MNHTALGVQVFAARRKRGQSVGDLARKLGISESMLTRLEHGERTWSEALYWKALKP